MATIRLEDLSSFGRLAVKLDTAFSELVRISGQIQRLEIDSDSGLDHGIKLLNQFAQHGKDISEGIQDFSKFLQEARERSEAAAHLVADRAEVIGKRKQEQNQIRERLIQVEQDVQAANARLVAFKKEGNGEYSDDEKLKMKAELERLNVELKKFLENARGIKDAAAQSKFRGLERDAQTIVDALRSSSRQLEKVINQP